MYSENHLVEQHRDGIEVAREGVRPHTQGFEGDGAATCERVNDERPGAGRTTHRLVCGLGQSAADVKVLAHGRVIPVREIGDEVKQREPELVEVGWVVRVEIDPLRPGRDNPLPLAETLLRGRRVQKVVL